MKKYVHSFQLHSGFGFLLYTNRLVVKEEVTSFVCYFYSTLVSAVEISNKAKFVIFIFL
jgi:hypothetical protein